MAEDKEMKAVIKAMSFGVEIINILILALIRKGGSIKHLQRLVREKSLVEQVADLLLNAPNAGQIGDYVTSMVDEAVPERLMELVIRWRVLADFLDYAGPIAWRVRAGFTLKKVAPLVGPCFQKFSNIQDWNFTDESTGDLIVFWIPRLLRGSELQSTAEHQSMLAKYRQEYCLPPHHLSNFGQANLMAALILAHQRTTHEEVPMGLNWIRTDSIIRASSPVLGEDKSRRLYLSWKEHSLSCDAWDWAERRSAKIGVFALGVEEMKG